MTTVEFFVSGYQWLMADWTHPIAAAAFFTAVTPTPAPGTLAAKIYKFVDVVAVNVLHAKSTGITPANLAVEVATLLEQKQKEQANNQQVQK